MDRNLALKSFTKVETRDLNKVKGWGNIDPKLSEAMDDLVGAAEKCGNVLTVYDCLKGLSSFLKFTKCGINLFRLADDVRKIGPINSNLNSLREVNRVLPLDEVLPPKEASALIKSSVSRRRKEFFKENEIKFKYFYSDYNEYKRGVREKDREYVLNKWNIFLLELDQSDARDKERLERLKSDNEKIEEEVSRRQLLKERVIHNEAISVNKHNGWRLRWKFGADLLSFGANLIELFKFPVVAAFVLACRTPVMLYGVCKKIYNKENICDRKIKLKDDHVLSALQLPALLVDLWKAIDKRIFKNIRGKSEESRKKEVLNEQMAFIKEKVSVDISDRLSGDSDKQKEFIERMISLKDLNTQKETVRELQNIRSRIGTVLNNKKEELRNEELKDEKLENNIKGLEEDIKRIALAIKSLAKDIEKQKKRLKKLEDEVINRAGKGAKNDSRLLEKSRLKALDEAICSIEKEKKKFSIGDAEVRLIKEAFLESKETIKVLNARPKQFYLKYFNLKPMEDEGRIESTAKFVVNHIKELPNTDNLQDMQMDIDGLSDDSIKKMKKEVEKSRGRMNEMLKTFNMDEKKAEEFIKNVIEYKLNKDNAPKSKGDLVKELVDSIKKEI